MGFWCRFLVFSLSVSLSVGKGLKVFNNVTDLQYSQMPSLFQLDNYDNCILLKSKSLYCFATIQLTPVNPENPSEVWRIIEETIELERNYRHDRLRHGICVQEVCPEIPASLYKVGNGSEELWRGLSDCYTAKYKELGLKGQVVKMQCENDEEFYEIDSVDWIYAIGVISLVLLSVTGSLYDASSNQNLENTKQSNVSKFLRCFSSQRNYNKLISINENEDAKDFACIQGVRTMILVIIVSGHTILVYGAGPLYNPQFVENMAVDPIFTFLSNGGLVCQVFFVISGWLLSYYTCANFEKKQFSVQYLPVIFALRMIRLLPVIILVVGFDATWLRHLGRGPLWQHAVDNEFQNCRKNYLWNFLFINNYYHKENMCLQQTWYVASEVQSFVAGLFVLYLVHKFPKHSGKIFGFFIVSGIFITFFDHYYHQYDIVFRFHAEEIYTTFIDDENWHEIYSAGHLQFASYVMALAAGHYYHKKVKIQKKKYKIGNKTSAFAITLMLLVVLGVINSAQGFYREGYEVNRFTAALYNSLVRIAFALPVIGIQFLLTINKNGIYRKLWGLNVCQMLGRLTFSVYLCHISFQRIKYGTSRYTLYVTKYILLHSMLGDIFVAFSMAVVICLLVEFPTGALQKAFLNRRMQKIVEPRAEDKTK